MNDQPNHGFENNQMPQRAILGKPICPQSEAPNSQVETALIAQRDLLDELSRAVIRTRAAFGKALEPERGENACASGGETSVPELAPIVSAIQSNNSFLSSVLRDLQSINARSVL